MPFWRIQNSFTKAKDKKKKNSRRETFAQREQQKVVEWSYYFFFLSFFLFSTVIQISPKIFLPFSFFFFSYFFFFSFPYTVLYNQGISGCLMVNKVDEQTLTSDFKSHWVPHLYGLVPHLSKRLNKLLQFYITKNRDAPRSKRFGLVGVYGIQTIVGYLMPNPLYTYILNI